MIDRLRRTHIILFVVSIMIYFPSPPAVAASVDLPEGSRIDYRVISVWEQYGVFIASGLVIMALQTMLIVALLINRSRRKKAEQERIEANIPGNLSPVMADEKRVIQVLFDDRFQENKDAIQIMYLNEAAAEAQSSTISAPCGFTVLAVDDEPTNLHVLKLLLEGDGYDVLTASSGLEAIELIKDRQHIDLVLIDVMMPGMSGFEVCRAIREVYSIYDLPIVMLTVRNTSEDVLAGFEAGANDVVVKPFVAKELRARVAALLKMKKSTQEALKSEMAFLQEQIKPHFLYNTLNTIAYYCTRDGEKAKELLNQFAEYLRNSFEFKSLEDYTPLKKELAFVSAYLEIEKARFGNRLQTVIEVEETAMDMQVPTLILQPIVENAVLHGVMKKLVGGTIEISVKRSGDEWQFKVQDNGVGMSREQVNELLSEYQNKDSRSAGIHNIHSRLQKLCGKGIQVMSEEGRGTTVMFNIPKYGGNHS